MERFSLICIGDKADFDSFKKFHRERKRFRNSRIDYRAISYKDLLDGGIPKIKTKKALFFLFFPCDYWNKNIEGRSYKGIYGNRTFHKKFVRFFKRVDSSIRKNFPKNRIYFINPPLLSSKYRDKIDVKKLLLDNNLSTPPLVRIKRPEDIYRYLSRGISIFIKVRYGSMGKGITLISPLGWKTNFTFRDRRILCRKSDYGWRFRDVTGKKAFLRKLLRSDVYAEEAVDPLLLKGKKFDLRLYCFFGKVVFIYPRSNLPENIITNISQEGEGEYPAFLRPLPKSLIKRVKDLALKATKILGLNFAGVDLIVDRRLNSLYIIDVNVFPGFPNKRIFNLAKHLIDCLKSPAITRYL